MYLYTGLFGLLVMTEKQVVQEGLLSSDWDWGAVPPNLPLPRRRKAVHVPEHFVKDHAAAEKLCILLAFTVTRVVKSIAVKHETSMKKT